MKIVNRYISRLILTLTLALSFSLPALALDASTYASESVLASGNWVKISVKESGMHFLSTATLRRMGFNDPSRVRVYGYGAVRLPDKLDNSYIDDLPQVQTLTTATGIHFYATGPVSVEKVLTNNLVQKQNPFTVEGYYFLTDNDTPAREATPQPVKLDRTLSDTFTEIVYHERDLINPGETGHEMLGEDFANTSSQSFTFQLPGIAAPEVWLECSFYALSSIDTRIVLSVNDNALSYSSSDQIKGTKDHYTHAVSCLTRKTFTLDGGDDRARVTVTHSRTSSPSMARLNYLTLNYTRRLELTGGRVDFHLTDCGGRISGTSATTHLWDVTDPLNIIAIELSADGSWQPAATGLRHYAAWTEGSTLPAPTAIGRINNQNIHAEETPDMVIFTHSDWRSEAERVADIHRSESNPLKVLVVDQTTLYNEFSSGAPDANAFRKLLKMFWDRSTPGAEHRLRYAMIMGRSIYDNRRLMTTSAALPYPTLPGWQSDNCLSDNSSFTTDDIYAMLSDGAGETIESDYQCIGVGRMPVTSLNDARNVVDKLVSYLNTPINTTWKNRVIMVADDGNQAKFMQHSDQQIDKAMATPGGRRAFFQKVYLDAYERRNSTYPGARSDMFRMLTEGAVWWNFAGHANPSSWTGDGLMTYADINNLYLKHFPFTVAATCDFLRWDSRTISAAEILYRTPGSGIIGAISATRPAYIDRNGDLLSILGEHMFALEPDGRNIPIGEIYRRLKNNSAGTGVWRDTNKLRYVLMGDPAMRLCIPERHVVLDGINGMAPDLESQTTIMARQDVTLTGHITNPDGSPLDDFNGSLSLTLYDAESSTTSHGYGDDGEQYTFEQQGKRLQTTIDSVRNGRFEVKMIMPAEIADNFRPAALNMYAMADDGRDAVGINRDFYVFGVDENSVNDDIAPVIEAFYLNHESFAPGDAVNTTPVVIARVSDNRSINLSSAGIGHQMLLTIDGRSLTDVPLYYTPYSDGSAGGTIVYQLEELAQGDHTLRLRVWDTSGNSASETIDFSVARNIAPKLYDLYADANPASVSTNFYLTHDRPDALVTVTIEVFNLLGRPVWSTTMTGMSDTLRSFPVNWNLTDKAGRRVSRGIYLYRASITDPDGITSATETRRIAVTGH